MSYPEEVKKYLIAWKCKYGTVYTSNIEDQLIVYRGLFLKEMLALQDYSKIDEIFEQGIIELCVLHPTPLTFQKEGSYVTLAEEIRKASGWEEPDTLVNSIEEKKKILEEDAISMVCSQLAVFYGVPKEKIENTTFDIFTLYCAEYELSTGKSFFAAQPKQSNEDILRRLGADTESPVEMERPMSREEYLNKQGMDMATAALSSAINRETPENSDINTPPAVFDWERDLKDLKRDMTQ